MSEECGERKQRWMREGGGRGGVWGYLIMTGLEAANVGTY
jgi:hypothetical protein